MRITRKHIRKLILKELNLFTEAEGDEEAAEDLFGGDEGGEETDAEEGEEGGEEGAEEEGAEEEEEEGAEGEEAEEEKAPEPETPSGPVDDTVDTAINAVMLDFETEALTSYEQEEQMKTAGVVAAESRLSLSSLLFEAEDEEAIDAEAAIDIDNFSSNVARLINNYTNLLDMEQLIFSKALDFLTDKYGEEAAKEFEDTLDVRHGIAFQASQEVEPESYAVGAASSAVVGE
jgi:hypothetical protein